MIPRILELKNFLSYPDSIQTIDFTPYNLICLSGKNGNGKSALLDAITWALWGQARKVTGSVKADEGLVRLGQTRMMVSLEFSFANRIYRVRREFAKTYGKPYAALDFEIFNESENRFLSLTDKTIRATQGAIDRLLGLDFDTFVNSAFLRQGAANEFSKKSAKERKHILASILGLNQYDSLQQQALDKARGLMEEKKSITRIIEQYNQELTKQQALILEETQEKLAIEKLTSAIALAELQLQTLSNTEVTLKAQCLELEQCAASLPKIQESHKQLLVTLQNTVTAWKKTHYHMLTLPPLTMLNTQKAVLTSKEKEFIEKQKISITLQEKILAIKQQLHMRNNALDKEHEQKLSAHHMTLQKQELAFAHHTTLLTTLSTQLTELTSKQKSLEDAIGKAKLSLSAAEQFETNFNANKKQFEKRRTSYQTLIQRGNWTKNALTELEHKQKVVHDTNNPACPLCEQLLTSKRKQFLAQQFTHDETFLQHRLDRLSALIKKLKELLLEQHTHIESQTTHAEALTRTRLQLHEYEKSHTALTAEHAVALTTQEKLAAISTTMEKNIAALRQQGAHLTQENITLKATDTQLISLEVEQKKLEDELTLCAIDPLISQALQTELHNIDQKIALHTQHIEHTKQQHERRLMVANTIQTLKKVRIELLTLHEKLATLPTITQNHQTLTQQIIELTTSLSGHRSTKELSLQKLGSLEHEIKRLHLLSVEVGKKNTEAGQFDGEIEDYQHLATAFSKNGIQALLIEQAIPEIEHDANALLAQLTDNQAQIFIESLRDLKSGGVKETLDIQIADSSGIRPYEMYSGGEAFRVDFALRIAISKLLARRAGTALQTLIIDEGFGSQDEEGLAHIMDALYAIQSDFSKIIVVSHLPELKHNFPVHFVVEKGPSGSHVRIEERG